MSVKEGTVQGSFQMREQGIVLSNFSIDTPVSHLHTTTTLGFNTTLDLEIFRDTHIDLSELSPLSSLEIGGIAELHIAPVEAPEPLNDWMKIYTAPRGRWVGLRPDHDPRFAKALLSFRSPLISYDRGDVEAQKRLVRQHFEGLGWHTAHILEGLDAAEDFYFDTTSRVVVPEWSRGRVVLVGDAGYCGSPLAGHGTALSLVGAYILAGELAAANGDHVRAFPAYQTRMQAYADQRMELPPGGIKMAMPMTSVGIRYRDTSIRLMTSRLMSGVLAKLAAKPDAIDLPEYSIQRRDPLRVAAEEAE